MGVIEHKRGESFVTLDEIVTPPPGGVNHRGFAFRPLRKRIHDKATCAASPGNCVLHSPSGHRLRAERMYWSPDLSNLILRRCPQHGYWHWDPDSADWFVRTYQSSPEPDNPTRTRFHYLYQTPQETLLRRETPKCFIGNCCGCCGPIGEHRFTQWYASVFEARSVDYREWQIAVRDEKQRQMLEQQRLEAEKLARQTMPSYNPTYTTSANLSWNVKTVNSSSFWIPTNGTP